MRDADNIRAVESLGVDCLGFIFWPRSARCCSSRPDYLPTLSRRVGVFVDAEVETVVERYVDYGLDSIQLHGREDRAYVMALRRAIGALPEAQYRPYHVIKAVSVGPHSDLDALCEPLVGSVDYFLFDTSTPGRGGSGRHFDWSLLSRYTCMTPFFLSGGIGPDDAAAVRAVSHPCCVGIDLNSRFETAPGLKDVGRLRSFIAQVR